MKFFPQKNTGHYVQCFFIYLRLLIVLCNLSELCEALFISYSHISENLTVQINAGLLKTIHELAVGKTVQSCSCIDTSDPELTELTFSLLTTSVRRCQGTHYGLLSYTILFASGSSVTFCKF